MAYNGSATNLRRHLFAKHNITAAAYESQLAQLKRKPDPMYTSMPSLSRARRKELDEAIVDCVIDDALPFTAFSKPGMLNLIRTFDSRYEPPSRFTIASRLTDTYHAYVDEVKVSPRLSRLTSWSDWQKSLSLYETSAWKHTDERMVFYLMRSS